MLTYPGHIRAYGLPYYLVEAGAFPGLVTGYPTILSCDGTGCRKRSRTSFLRQFSSSR